MNDTLSTPGPAAMTDADVVRRIEQYLTAKPTDHMLGTQVRLLFELRAAIAHSREELRPIATDDNGWPMLNSEGTAWERHDDPELG